MRTDNKMHVQTPDESSCPLKDNSNVMSIYSNTNLAIFFEVHIYYICARSSCDKSGIKAGLCATFLVLVGHYKYDDVGENAEALVQ